MAAPQFPYTSSTIPKMDCNREFCMLMYKSHKDTLTKVQNLEQQNATLQTRYTQLLDHRVTSGTVNPQNQAVLPNGDVLSAETFMQRTRMFEQNRAVMDRMQKDLERVQKELTATKVQLDKKSQQAREFENRLNGFQRAQTYTYTNEQHRAAAQANEEFEKRVHALQRENDKLRSKNAELVHRTNFVPCDTVGGQQPPVPLACPYGECTYYNNTITGSPNPAKLYHNHLVRHRVSTMPFSAPSAHPNTLAFSASTAWSSFKDPRASTRRSASPIPSPSLGRFRRGRRRLRTVTAASVASNSRTQTSTKTCAPRPTSRATCAPSRPTARTACTSPSTSTAPSDTRARRTGSRALCKTSR